MDKVYKHQDVEKKWYELWEKRGYFTPKVEPKKKPFCIIMPPPNANGSLHIGHAMFLTIEDIMIRYHRMLGDSTLWLPGADHAGILTQVVFERKLEKEEGKTRYDLGRDEFFRRCMEFTLSNKKIMENQMRAIGASCDWNRTSFTLDPKFNKPINMTFKKLYADGLLYRAKRMINWCPRCSTALSDLEVIYKEQKDPLYYIRYGPFVLATVRPETKFGDTAVAVHPKDKRYQRWIDKEFEFETLIGKAKMKVIGDDAVDPKFGTGVVKVTPAHDPVDFEMGQRHGLETKRVIDFDGKLNDKCGKYKNLNVYKARKIVAEDMQIQGLLEKVDENYTHSVAICERCKTIIEPMVSLQWFVKAKPLAEKAIRAVKNEEIKIIPKRFIKNYLIWMENIRDWCISRQLWWGHRLPVWFCGTKNLSELQLTMNPSLPKSNGCGEIVVSVNPPNSCPKCQNKNLIQDPDTLDTWFSSGQWPFTTLDFGQSNSKLTDFNYFYPTSVMETGYEILFFWVARMVMLGIYMTGKIPFEVVYLHGLVRDAFGEKMSKSKGNVIDPLNIIERYGADSLRMALIFGTSTGRDVKLGESKIEAMRNFGNKLWNIGRFIKINIDKFKEQNIKIREFNTKSDRKKLSAENKKILSQLGMLTQGVTREIENYNFAASAERLYKFIWHTFADKYIESVKEKLRQNDDETLSVTIYTYSSCLKLLHPFMPFITEEINFSLTRRDKPLISSHWS
ncbi:valine--tRNA ligase [Candidatus Gottesmanbacteria bacterium RIFCSPLOWO2_01_FULL_39_12b]|uniref:Valine--tRNA ligase n=1 Tax=Candidatus Gottesmanbacteria bacterium RIFCSPLOWO2_01_FULL_39_12b TaxID=1798388 RepID=A0A1F6AS61_9BACT|nr:MAG: valine--tRNA ligase [Candidatus Gottesmanbacteria bacterium RIFCSPLOWO2_01_FULL_39_12b]